jgi:hypothetical protein
LKPEEVKKIKEIIRNKDTADKIFKESKGIHLLITQAR